MGLIIKPVQNRKDLREFLSYPWKLYKDDPLWIPHLLPQLLDRFDPEKNPVINDGLFAAYMAFTDNNLVGTIAVAIDTERNSDWNETRAIFGFFECIEDYSVAKQLFDKAIEWTKNQGASSIWGPWYYDYEDAHGFLIKERDHKPALMCAHNKPYYVSFAEKYGMRKARRDSVAFIIEIDPLIEEMMPEKLRRVSSKVKDRFSINIRTANLDRFDDELQLVTRVLNRGLAVLDERGFWDIDRMMAHARDLKPILDPDLIIIAEIDDEPIGWVLGLPDLNDAIRKGDGLRHFWNYPSFYLALRQRPEGVSMKSIVVDPDYWNRGVDALMIHELGINILKKGYSWIDMSLTGEDNPMTPRLASNLGAREYKRYRIYEIDC